MTFEEAKELLENRGYALEKVTSIPYTQSEDFVGTSLYEAVRIVNARDYHIYNPALKESAKQFNDALLDEQANRIKGLEMETEHQADIIASRVIEIKKLRKEIMSQKKEIKHLNKLLSSRNKEIWELKDDVKHLCNEIDRLNVIMKGKDELLDKYRINDANKEDMIAALRKELAEKVVNKVDENALKSAESALAYKDSYIKKLTKKYEQLKKKLDLTEVGRKEKDLSGFVSDVIEKQKEFNYWLGELNDLINKTSLDEIVYSKEEDEETPSYPTEDNPDEVSLADMVKIVIEAFFDGKSVIIK